MKTAAIPIKRADIVTLHQDASSFALTLKEILNDDEFGYLMEILNGRAIPEPQLLIKDHKKKKNGHYPTRLVIPATNFAATFSKIGYLGIKKIFDDNGVRYNKYTIQQASDLKQTLEKLNLRKNKVTIMSLDIVNMYPSTKLSLIKQAIRYYAKDLSTTNRNIIERCIEMIAFGMKTTLVRFQDKYYNYKGVVGNDMGTATDDDNGLAIGAYEAAFCADASATFVYEMCENIFDKMKYLGTYRDDGLTVFEGRKTRNEAIRWLRTFQMQVNKVVGGNFFQFTAEVWNPKTTRQLPTVDEEIPEDEWNFWAEKVTVIEENAFPYLDMQLSWRQDNLYFSVYSKENQTIKYVNKESCHRQSVFKAVPAGVFTRLGRLTSVTKDNQDTPILDFYPLHREALKKAKLLPKNVPTLQELHQQEDDRQRRAKKKEEEMENKQDGRTCYFVIGHS
jgi:hypothetical protein